MISGELGINIRHIHLRKFKDGTYDIKIHDKDGGVLILCGQNDAKTIFENALQNIEDWEETMNRIRLEINGDSNVGMV